MYIHKIVGHSHTVIFTSICIFHSLFYNLKIISERSKHRFVSLVFILKYILKTTYIKLISFKFYHVTKAAKGLLTAMATVAKELIPLIERSPLGFPRFSRRHSVKCFISEP